MVLAGPSDLGSHDYVGIITDVVLISIALS